MIFSKNFGEIVDGYDLPMLNEREARAAAGFLFAFGMVSFMRSFLIHDFNFTKIFVTFFMIDFFIRIFISPRYAPSLILGRLMVTNQRPEYVTVPQKRFAWSIGFGLSLVMFLLIVVFEIMTPIKIVICIICLVLLFSESALGICLGCKIYPFFSKQTLYCGGDSCQIKTKEPILKISSLQYAIMLFFIILFGIFSYLTLFKQSNINALTPPQKCELGKCQTGKCGN